MGTLARSFALGNEPDNSHKIPSVYVQINFKFDK